MGIFRKLKIWWFALFLAFTHIFFNFSFFSSIFFVRWSNEPPGFIRWHEKLLLWVANCKISSCAYLCHEWPSLIIFPITELSVFPDIGLKHQVTLEPQNDEQQQGEEDNKWLLLLLQQCSNHNPGPGSWCQWWIHLQQSSCTSAGVSFFFWRMRPQWSFQENFKHGESENKTRTMFCNLKF